MAGSQSKKRSKSIDGFELNDRIKYLRTDRGFTQAALAKKAKISVSTIAQMEAGLKDPTVKTLEKLAKALNIQMAVFFASDEVVVFDFKKLRKDYKTVDSLKPTIYMALGKTVQYAKDIGFIN